jgi:lipid-A-disaccharide synthase
MKKYRLLISCGEVSGDQRGSEVVESLKTICPSIQIRGMGGAQLAASGVEILVDARKGGGVMGFVEVASKIHTLYRSYSTMVNEIRSWRPDAVLLVDFPDFNLRLAKVARSCNIPVYYYIPPKVWAWRAGRVEVIKRTVSAVGCIFPFEPQYYVDHDFRDVEYVGHPFLQSFRGPSNTKAEMCKLLGVKEQDPIALVMPGSRSAEVTRHVPSLVQALTELRRSIPTLQSVWVSPSPEKMVVLEHSVRQELARFGSSADGQFFTNGDARDLMYYSDFGLLKSGTCNLEAAFAGLPFVSFYKASPISVFIARYVVKLKEVSLVNICKPQSVVELIQESCNGKAIVEAVNSLLGRVDRVRQDLADVRAMFGDAAAVTVPAPLRVAGRILSFMEQGSRLTQVSDGAEDRRDQDEN